MSESVKSDQHEPYWIRRVRRSDFYSKCILPYPRLCWLFIESHGTIPTVIRLRVYRLRGLQTKLQISMCGLGFNPSDAQWPELSPLTDLCRDACWWRLKWNRLESRGWPCLPLQPAIALRSCLSSMHEPKGSLCRSAICLWYLPRQSIQRLRCAAHLIWKTAWKLTKLRHVWLQHTNVT